MTMNSAGTTLTESMDRLHGPDALDPASTAWEDALTSFLQQLASAPPGNAADFARAEQTLLFCLRQDHVAGDQLAQAGLRLLFNQQAAVLVERARSHDPDGRSLWFLQQPTLRRLLLSPLLHAVLELVPLCNPAAERLLTATRHGLLLDISETRQLEPEHWRFLLPLLNGMAVNGPMAEYAWVCQPAELAATERLIADLCARPIGASLDRTIPALLLAAAYRPLAVWPQVAGLLEQHEETLLANGMSSAVLDWHRDRPREQTHHAAMIESRGRLRTETSIAVGQHYEANPYPRWSWLFKLPAMRWPFYLGHDLGYQPALSPPDVADVLVAGCGTGKHPLHLAMMLSHCRIEAMDLSRASLAYTRMMAQRHGLLDRLALFRGDILDLPDLGRRYDLIESVGVIHHMADPAAGLMALKACLKPGSWLKLGLYSEAARWAVRDIRATYGQDHAMDDPAVLRGLRQRVMDEPSAASRYIARTSSDFYTLSGFRDLLFHRHEHRFTIPQIQSLLDKAGLRFMGFSHIDEQPRDRYRRMFPDDPRMVSLENWHRLEQQYPDTFWRLYNFWCHLPA